MSTQTAVILDASVFVADAHPHAAHHGEAARLYSSWPGVHVVPVTEELAELAIETAANYRLRGCDAVYVALAVQQRAVLVTLDKEQHARAAEAVEVQTPASALRT